MEQINETISAIVDNATQHSNKTGKTLKGTTTGLTIAYGALIFMSVIPIFFGSFRSFTRSKKSKVTNLLLQCIIDDDIINLWITLKNNSFYYWYLSQYPILWSLNSCLGQTGISITIYIRLLYNEVQTCLVPLI